MNFLKKIIESDKRELKRLEKIADQIESYATAMEPIN